MIIDPKDATHKECYKLMIGSIVPRPIAFVSTISREGVTNLAPFSYFTAITARPPTVCFAPGRRGTGGQKDTLHNIEETGEFVVNVVTVDLGAAMNETATDFPPEVDEFEVSGLTPEPCRVVKPPRVAESPVSFECRLRQVVDINRDEPGGGSLVIGEIVMFHVADGLYDGGRIDVERLDPLGRLAGDRYTTLGRLITHKRKNYPMER